MSKQKKQKKKSKTQIDAGSVKSSEIEDSLLSVKRLSEGLKMAEVSAGSFPVSYNEALRLQNSAFVEVDSLKVSKGQQGRILNVLQDNAGMEKIYVDQYSTISDIVFVESCNENFIQVADICAYNVFRQFIKFGREFCQEKVEKIPLKMEMYSYFEKIRCNFYYNPSNNKVTGCGLICLPDTNKINWDILGGCFNNKKTPLK